VVQYGVTRDRLARVVREAPGWDVLHLSGHGTAGAFLLEGADGSPDLVAAAELAGLLRSARRRVKLAVLSACESAAGTTARTLRLIGLDEQAQAVEAAQPDAAQPNAGQSDAAPAEVTGLARVLVATPGLFGARAAGLTLAVPRGRPRLDPAAVKMERFPPEPVRFVGRAGPMAVASAALAPRNGRTTVVLHGMAGAGKTACALELAYRHQDGFGAVAFWQAPTREGEWAGALASLAAALEVQLGGYGFTMAGHIGTAAAVEVFAPRLRKLMADSGVLLVLDNLETLLTPDGTWRDPAWGLLAGAAGRARRRVTADPDQPHPAGRAGRGTGGADGAGPCAVTGRRGRARAGAAEPS
jgi:CHAT domain